jgi:hypothetical protein
LIAVSLWVNALPAAFNDCAKLANSAADAARFATADPFDKDVGVFFAAVDGAPLALVDVLTDFAFVDDPHPAATATNTHATTAQRFARSPRRDREPILTPTMPDDNSEDSPGRYVTDAASSARPLANQVCQVHATRRPRPTFYPAPDPVGHARLTRSHCPLVPGTRPAASMPDNALL